MLDDTVDAESVNLLSEVLTTPGNRLAASIVTASDDGIHCNAVHQAARIIHAVCEHSPHGQGNFNFAAIAMLKPYGPFYPGAWHPGSGLHSFAIGLQSANVVMDIFASTRDPLTAGKALTEALALHARAVEAAAMKAASNSDWTYAMRASTLLPLPVATSPLGPLSNPLPASRSMLPEQKLLPPSSPAP